MIDDKKTKTFTIPDNKDRENSVLSFLVGVAVGAMVLTMIIFFVVVDSHSNAYAKNIDGVFDKVSDILYVPPVIVEETMTEETGQAPVVEETEPVVQYEDSWEQEVAYIENGYYQEPYYSVDYGYTPYQPQEPDVSNLRYEGVQYDADGIRYTWYSENVLPGGGLDIPGRHVGDGGYITDGNGNLCVASSDYEIGTVLETPYGTAVVYDTGCASGTVDMYTSW